MSSTNFKFAVGDHVKIVDCPSIQDLILDRKDIYIGREYVVTNTNVWDNRNEYVCRPVESKYASIFFHEHEIDFVETRQPKFVENEKYKNLFE